VADAPGGIGLYDRRALPDRAGLVGRALDVSAVVRVPA
jgi:hypothetical protein